MRNLNPATHEQHWGNERGMTESCSCYSWVVLHVGNSPSDPIISRTVQSFTLLFVRIIACPQFFRQTLLSSNIYICV